MTDTLGHNVTCTIGNLINIHPHIMHRDSLNDAIFDALQHVAITPDKAIALDSSPKEYYSQIMDSGNKMITYVPPFKLFPSHPGIGSGKTRIVTDGIRIHSMPQHSSLFSKLLAHLFKEVPTSLSHMQFLPNGMPSIVGNVMFHQILEKKQ